MHINRSSIGGLIGEHVSSIVKWGYQDNFKPVYFFYGKILHAQKHSQANINQQNKIKQTLNNKGNNFLHAQKFLRGWKAFVLRFSALCVGEIVS